MGKNKRFPPGKCIHCLRDFEKLTSDHVFPDSWYPDTTPQNMEKWQAPCCEECNRDHGKNEEYLLYRFGLCISPEEAKASGIPEKTLRAMDPAFAKDEKQKKIRQGKRSKIIKELMNFDSPPTEGVLPGFGIDPSANYNNEFFAITIPEENLLKLTTKLVKGITYVLEKKYIDDSYAIESFFLNEGDLEEMVNFIEKHATLFERGPGISVKRALAQDDPNCGLFYMEIWGKFRYFSSVLPKEH